MKAYQHLETFQGSAKFSTWLYAIARNHCFNHLRVLKRQRLESGEESLRNMPDGSAGQAFQGLEKESAARQLRELLAATLDRDEQQVLYLHYAEEIPLDAITRTMGLTNPSGAKAYIVNAKRKLQRALAGRRR